MSVIRNNTLFHKNKPAFQMLITLLNVNESSKFFHHWIQQEISSKAMYKYLIDVVARRYKNSAKNQLQNFTFSTFSITIDNVIDNGYAFDFMEDIFNINFNFSRVETS